MNLTVKMVEGATVVITGRNFDGLADADVKARLHTLWSILPRRCTWGWSWLR